MVGEGSEAGAPSRDEITGGSTSQGWGLGGLGGLGGRAAAHPDSLAPGQRWDWMPSSCWSGGLASDVRYRASPHATVLGCCLALKRLLKSARAEAKVLRGCIHGCQCPYIRRGAHGPRARIRSSRTFGSVTPES